MKTAGEFAARLVRQGRCLLWQGALMPNGYGYVRDSVARRMVYAHRFAWELVHGKIPTGLLVLHACRNKNCVAIEHLRLGDTRQNALDRHRDGTWKNPSPHLFGTHCSKGHLIASSGVYLQSDGSRCCKPCRNQYEKRHRKEQRFVGAMWGVIACLQSRAEVF